MLERDSAELGASGRLRAGAGMLAGGLAPGEVAEAVRRTGADVVHAHNVYPLWGSRALAAARRAGAAVVMHLHNYRLFCSIGIGYRDGASAPSAGAATCSPACDTGAAGICPRRQSTAPACGASSRGSLEAVGRFVAPSAFAADRLGELGLRRDRISVAHNFLPAGQFAAAPPDGGPEYALFAGRLVGEKGIDTAVEAAAHAGVPLAIAGTGPEASRSRPLREHRGARALPRAARAGRGARCARAAPPSWSRRRAGTSPVRTR